MTRPANLAPGPGDLDRLVHCGVEGHPSTLDSDGECAACIAEEEEAENAREARRETATAGLRRRWLGRGSNDILLALAAEISAHEPFTPIALLAEFARRERQHSQWAFGWRAIYASCADRCAEEDERERAERAAEDAAAQAEHLNDCKEDR